MRDNAVFPRQRIVGPQVSAGNTANLDSCPYADNTSVGDLKRSRDAVQRAFDAVDELHQLIIDGPVRLATTAPNEDRNAFDPTSLRGALAELPIQIENRSMDILTIVEAIKLSLKL